MAGEYLVEIYNGSKSAANYKSVLKKFGFSWDGKCWKRYFTFQDDIVHWEDWCRLRGLKMKAIGYGSERGGNYRAEFFAHNPPMFGDKYACAYCGKRMTKRQVQVDHIIAVDLAKRHADVRRKIQAYGWDDVNDTRNLCAACGRCNRLKANHGGLWIARGRLGKKVWW